MFRQGGRKRECQQHTGNNQEDPKPPPGRDGDGRAVMADFFERHRLGGIRISINDAGATPAIVALRLDQAIEEFTRAAPA